MKPIRTFTGTHRGVNEGLAWRCIHCGVILPYNGQRPEHDCEERKAKRQQVKSVRARNT